MLVSCEGLNISLRETADVVFLLCTHTEVVNGLDCKSIVREFKSHCVLLNGWRNDMRPKRYPYSKSQWEKEYANVYWDSSNEPLATFVTHINRLTGEVK